MANDQLDRIATLASSPCPAEVLAADRAAESLVDTDEYLHDLAIGLLDAEEERMP